MFSIASAPEAQIGLLTCPEQHMAGVTMYSKISGGRQLYQRCVLGMYDTARQGSLPVKLSVIRSQR